MANARKIEEQQHKNRANVEEDYGGDEYEEWRQSQKKCTPKKKSC